MEISVAEFKAERLKLLVEAAATHEPVVVTLPEWQTRCRERTWRG
ncbi:MAG: hypothetical protein AB7Q81_25340 [Gammaproteobacteria bacterium]